MGEFLEQIPVISSLVKCFPSMDFEGQKLAEKLYQFIIILFAMVGFVWGYACQQFAQTVYILGAGVLLAGLLVLPPWQFFRKCPLAWQEVQVRDTKPPPNSGSGKRKDKQRT